MYICAAFTLEPRVKQVDPSVTLLGCNGTSLSFPKTAISLTYAPGDVLMGVLNGASDAPSPCNLLSRKVTDVASSASSIILATVPAILTDIFSNADIYIPDAIAAANTLPSGPAGRKSRLLQKWSDDKAKLTLDFGEDEYSLSKGGVEVKMAVDHWKIDPKVAVK